MDKIIGFEKLTQDELRGDLRTLFRGAILLTLEIVLEEELKAMVGARRFERIGSREDYRNGTYLRRLLTSMGQLDVTVPRSREQGSPTEVIGSYQRRSTDIDEMMVEAYVSGVSQRKMSDVTEALLGEREGRSAVSQVAKRLDETGELKPEVVGLYGIGVCRLLACVGEMHHDDYGPIRPIAIAPYPVHLLTLGPADSETNAVAEQLYAELQAAGLEVLFDDRDRKDRGLIPLADVIPVVKAHIAELETEIMARAGHLPCRQSWNV